MLAVLTRCLAQNANRSRCHYRDRAKRNCSFSHHQQLCSCRQREGISRRKGRCVCKSKEQVIDKSGRPIFELVAADDARLLLGKQEIAFRLGNDASCGGPPRSSDQNQRAKTTTLVAQIFAASNSSVLPPPA
jgi:hypothetical protein